MKLDSVLNYLKNDCHVPIAVAVIAALSAYHMITHRDLGPNYVSCVNSTYMFLGGHAGIQVWNKIKGGDNGTS
jgi:hypothetical protein